MFDIRLNPPVIKNERHQSLGPVDPQRFRHAPHLIRVDPLESIQINTLLLMFLSLMEAWRNMMSIGMRTPRKKDRTR